MNRIDKMRNVLALSLVAGLAACSGAGSIAPQTVPAAASAAQTSASAGAAAETSASSPTPAPSASPATGKYALQVDIPAEYPVINQTANANTWLVRRVQTNDTGLPTTVTHLFKSGSSLADVTTVASENPGAPVIFYDIEHWTATPATEQANPAGSIAQAAQIVHAHGKKFGIVPDGLFMGLNPSKCTANINAGIIPSLDWTKIDVVDIQAQALANNKNCGGTRNYGIQNYTSYVNAVATYVRAKNPNIVILSHVGLRDSTPDWAINAAHSVSGVVNAITVTYPAPCTNCTLDNLTQIIKAL